MVQWPNLQRIKRFVNPTRLYISCEKAGGQCLAEPGLTACSQADKIWAKFEVLKAYCRSKYLAKVPHCFSNFNAFLMLFSGKHYYKVVL